MSKVLILHAYHDNNHVSGGNMEINQCEAVLKAVETGSLSAAAEALHYTQSGITRMIRALENELGYEVFFRSKRGVSLTENGKAMLPLFTEIVQAHNNAKEFSSHLTGLLTGTLNIGTYYSISALCLPPILKGFCALYPGITINLTEGGNRRLFGNKASVRIPIEVFSNAVLRIIKVI